MIAFKDFIEDYNTATMPHDKYYNLEAWEMNEYRRLQMEKANKTGNFLLNSPLICLFNIIFAFFFELLFFKMLFFFCCFISLVSCVRLFVLQILH